MTSGTEQLPRSDRATDAGKSLGPACARITVTNTIAAKTTAPTANADGIPLRK